MKKEKDYIEELNPYTNDKLSKIPSILIITILKYWAAAAAVFFGIIGGLDVGLNFSEIDTTDLVGMVNTTEKIIIILALIIALLMNYIIKNLVYLMYNRRNNTLKYNMVNIKGFVGFVFTLAYNFILSILLLFIVYFFSIRGLIPNLFGESGVGLEPFSYGLFYICVDGIFLLIKYFIVNISQRVVYKRQLRRA